MIKRLLPVVALLALVSVGGGSYVLSTGSRGLASLPAGEGYCLAIRGNGELMPAHWGGMAQAVEAFGLPAAVSGGSSASISAFLLESVLMNPSVGGENRELHAAFLLKSFSGFFAALMKRPDWRELLSLLETLQSGRASDDEMSEALAALGGSDPKKLAAALAQLGPVLKRVESTQLFAGPAVVKLLGALREYRASPTAEGARRLREIAREVEVALRVLGKFDARKDANLFIRDGVVNFRALAQLFGQMGDFYSLRGASPLVAKDVKNFVESCAVGSAGLSWQEIAAKNPVCQANLEQVVGAYFRHAAGEASRIYDKVGAHLPALISTAVAREEAAQELRVLKAEYEKNFDPRAGERLSLRNEDIRFGYWGRAEDLAAVATAFAKPSVLSQIDKSKRFYSLGETSWAEALSLSPAEPGLSGFLEFSARGENLVSLGGWADLHPVPALKALGCGSVVYLTRIGGDTLFGQGVAKRIFRFDDVTWDEIDPENVASVPRNNNGVRANQSGPWSMMFNLANAKSSYSVSLAAADAVICTNWNAFDIKRALTPMVEEAYRAPVYLKAPVQAKLRQPKTITTRDNAFDRALGYPPYAGCIYP